MVRIQTVGPVRRLTVTSPQEALPLGFARSGRAAIASVAVEFLRREQAVLRGRIADIDARIARITGEPAKRKRRKRR